MNEPKPKAIVKQASSASVQSESSGCDSMVADLKRDDFSISITKAKVIQPETTGSYFSMISSVSNGYALFTIETRCRLPIYESPDKLHVVDRRFSDFEFLLQQLTDKEEYKSYVFPQLPEKRFYNNLDAAFIERRRLELEGFLRVLVQQDNRIKNDMIINAFLTLEEEKYKEFRQNPSKVLNTMKSVFNAIPSTEQLKVVQNQGVTKIVKQMYKRVRTEI